MTSRQRREFFRVLVVEVAAVDQDRPNALLRKSCEGRFKIGIGVGIHNNELQAQLACCRLQVCDEELRSRTGRVLENAEPGSTVR